MTSGARPMRRLWNLVLRRRRPRVALVTSFPPDRPGVAAYVSAVGAGLKQVAELHLFTDREGATPLPGVAPVHHLDDLSAAARDFDRVVGIVANTPSHARVLRSLLSLRATCILHDGHLLDLYADGLGEERALAVAGRELCRPVGQAELEAWLIEGRKLEAMFLGEVMESAGSVIVHSAVTASRVAARFGRTPVHLPFPILREWSAASLQPGARRAARRRLGFEDGTISIVAPGPVRPGKATVESIEAMEMLQCWGVCATLYFTGSHESLPGGAEALRSYAAALGVGDAVQHADRVLPETTYRDYLAASDLALVGRSYDFGGVPGALLDCVGAGLPIVTNASLREAADIPDELARAVPDHLSPVLIAEALAAHAKTPRPEHGAMRAAFLTGRSLDKYTRQLCEALDLSVPARHGAAAGPAA